MAESNNDDVLERLQRIGQSVRQNVSLSDQVLDRLEADETVAPHLESPRPKYSITRFGDSKMIRRLSLSGLAAAALLTSGVWLFTSNESISFAQVAENLSNATSCSAEMSMYFAVKDQQQQVTVGKYYWRAPGDYRHETRSIGKFGALNPQDSVLIMFRDQPGISIDHVHKKYRRINPKRGYASPLVMLHELHRFKGLASKRLERREFDGVHCDGFEIDMKKIDPNVAGGTMTLWVDPDSQLPQQIRIDMDSTPQSSMLMKGFVWNESLDASLFTTNGPKGYVDTSPAEKAPSVIAEAVIESFKLYAELSDGKYPQVKVVYGDITRDKLMELAGLKGKDPKEFVGQDVYQKILKSTTGWAMLNELMVSNDTVAYHGITVDASQKDQVLLSWQRSDGKFQVIYGDLRTEAVGSL